ncbi:MAG: hypothetical protein KDB74_04135 [Flavobacteriales bacterium]|nr:hypothetical protein [Flavobacteriales bacterium]
MALSIIQEVEDELVIAEFSGHSYKLNEVVCFKKIDFGSMPSSINNSIGQHIESVMIAYVEPSDKEEVLTITDQMFSRKTSGKSNGLVLVYFELGEENYIVASEPTKGDVKIGLGA